jgi:hypothetical protein
VDTTAGSARVCSDGGRLSDDGPLRSLGYVARAAKADPLDVPPPPDYEPERISADDYFLKNHEFSAWLKSSKGKVNVPPPRRHFLLSALENTTASSVQCSAARGRG